MARTHHDAAHPGALAGGDWKAVGKRVASDVSRDNLSMIAAGVAFYGFFALFPALTALVSLYGLIADPAGVEELTTSMKGFLPPEGATIIAKQLDQVASTNPSQLGVGLAVSILVALWGATKGTKSLMTALNIAYEEEERRGFLRLNAMALALTLGTILMLIVAIAMVVAVPALLAMVDLPPPWRTAVNWLRWPLMAVLMVIGLAVFYRYGPSRDAARWSWVNYGSVVATVLWLLASGLFSWYVSNFGSYNETYGSMAAIAILLMWFFISAFVVLLGAEMNSEMELQTARDTTVGEPQPRGQRGATVADQVADDEGRGKFRA